MWLFSSRSGVSFLAHRSETYQIYFEFSSTQLNRLLKILRVGIPRPQTLRLIATESIGRSVRREPKMKKQEDARLAVLREYDRWAKDHPNDASMMGGFLFFRYLQTDKSDLLDFRSGDNKWLIVHGWIRDSVEKIS
jgi:hypothetical protein